jgi:hypothetical protein
MELRTLHQYASTPAALNQALLDVLEQPLPLPCSIQVHTEGWSASSWTLVVQGDPEQLEVRINGATVPLVAREQGGERCLVAVEAFWPDATPLTHQELSLSSKAQDGLLLQIEAAEAISPWQLFQLLRPDVASSSLEASLLWIVISGLHESNLLRQHLPLLSQLNAVASDSSQSLLERTVWQREDLQQAFHDIDAPAFREWLLHQAPLDHHWPPFHADGQLKLEVSPVQPWESRPFGVNLFGYAGEALGIAEDLRTCLLALQQAGVPVQLVDIPTRHCSDALRQRAREAPDQLAPYAFNLLCVTAEEHARVLFELGLGVFQERWTIGYWPWELSRWPEVWRPLFPMVDEVWASSRHTHEAIQSGLGGRHQPLLQQLPLPLAPLEPLHPEEHAQWRAQFGLPEDAPLLICSFDGRSSYWRKNPWAAIEAFQEAFATDETPSPHLVIKTMHAGLDGGQWKQLQRRAEADPRLILIDGILPRNQLLGLYGCADVLISLHRAEGYGRVLAEALMLGLQVVATDYSGNCDFCIGPHAHPVPYQLVPVQDGHYPHHAGQLWAEVDPSAAVDALRRAVAAAGRGINPGAVAAYHQLFSTAALGERYKQRLQEIWGQRHELPLQHRLKA